MLPDAVRHPHCAALNVTRSFSGRKWMFRESDRQAVRLLEQVAGVSPTLAQLLSVRQVAADCVADYLNPTLKRFLPEPLTLKDMNIAVARAESAVKSGETITVFGDYDVDGSCSAALLHDFLTALGLSPVLYVPDRLKEGYGPNAAALLRLKESGASLVITVDCGAAAHAALEAARNAHLDIIVLDHHAVDHEVPAVAHINPNRRGDESGLGYLCAAGVTFLFAVALNRCLRNSGWYVQNGIAEPDLRACVDLVGLATICDVVPLVGVNRAFVRSAQSKLSALERPGIRALAAVAAVEPPFTAYHCGFVFGPRINAGGRVGRSSLGAELLTERNDSEALILAQQLDRHNRERQAIEALIVQEAIGLAANQSDRPYTLVSGDGWHPGVVGIVAGRLKERYRKPAIVIGFEGGLGRGSARSVPGIDIGSVIRRACEAGILESGGGHAMAAGLSLASDRFDAFGEHLAVSLASANDKADCQTELTLDALVSTSGATPALAEEIERAGPFGAGNSEPVLAACGVRLAYADIVGQGHMRLRLEGGDGSRLSAIAFRAAGTALGEALQRARGGHVHAAGFLRVNRWNGRTEAQLQVEDAAAAA
ncbi:MAG TPA: single-stranded-DNA-specific exonuclease RecJ [Rhizomicrobium sp.]|jgi:single-stranded-DNA-specific exonuclease